ncbi:MAG: histidine phosphatase family protein [Planctomycetota bacterium]|nr:histidine phosphatase family protein [Planctomycetota bacterium]
MLSNLERTINDRRRIHLVRHGDVSYFDESGDPFHQDDVPLNEEGRGQARALARILEPVPLDRLIVSGLPRTVETAAILTENRGLEAEVRSELREISPGRLADIPAADLERQFTRALSANIERQSRFLGGETFGSLEDRVIPCFEEILADEKWKNLLIVAHGGTNRMVLAHALGAGLRTVGSIEQDPACLNVLDVNGDGTFIVRLLNYSEYSPVKDGIRLTTMERIYRSYLEP